ncbi:protein-L-isoaspartate O-methyltransferase family protein [Yunchengibacter salinarum]|uniref:protein-L-isoaspartate O-methyltransferase family protein n=1 Tax=Yunchengibacter salinarum TaxID=3133399 RepID=UPI0035B59736
MSDFALARQHMIDGQLKPSEVVDSALLDAMAEIPRELFVPKARRSVAYVDEDLSLGDGRYLMEPMVFARLVQAARIRPDEAVLDIGCTTGYSTAVLARLADAVVAVEEDAALVKKAEAALAKLEIVNAAVVEGALRDGVPGQGPYDVIFLGGAVSSVPDSLVRQLKEGGRLVTVLMDGGVGRAYMVTLQNGVAGGRELFDANVPMLPGFEAEKKFVFE